MAKVSRASLAQIVADQISRGQSIQKTSSQIAAFLLSERRVNELDSLLRDIQQDWANKGHVEVLAASAFPLSGEVKKTISNRIMKLYPDTKRVTVTDVRDPSVIGGVRLNLANQRLDLSIEAKLNKFRYLTATRGRTN